MIACTSPSEDGGSRPKLLSKLRKTITRTRDTEGPDSSSFTTFGQPLELCPVSMENKVWLPLGWRGLPPNSAFPTEGASGGGGMCEGGRGTRTPD